MSSTVSSQITTSIPLTTVFTPAPSCITDYYSSGICFLGQWPDPITHACLPSGWDVSSQHFSPGICPSGYYIACSSLVSLGTYTETQATCCPSSYSCQTDNNNPWFSTDQCFITSSNLTPTITITTSSGTITSIFPTQLPLPYGGVNAYGVSIRFQSTDFQTSSTVSSSLPIVSNSTALNSSANHHLTPGAKAGISVGIVIVILALIAATVFFIRYHRSSKIPPSHIVQTELYNDGPRELEGMRVRHELYTDTQRNIENDETDRAAFRGVTAIELQGRELRK
ncbi:hypothetical protein N431DRAFT_484149 [Stipitochalara longipes BDJ]|nr:hypothetical protein N431DRAFT_484149 [Stipitochalara longipes BDJ]